MGFFNKYEILHKYQFGFQRGKSTEHAVLDLLHNEISALETKDKTCLIFLDFEKAFDTANHDILFSKLEYYDYERGLPLELMNSYLSDRIQRVKTGGSTSKDASRTCGVPQESVLGPLLFLVYINDILRSEFEDSFHHLFADDTSLFFADKNIRILEPKSNSSLENITN